MTAPDRPVMYYLVEVNDDLAIWSMTDTGLLTAMDHRPEVELIMGYKTREEAEEAKANLMHSDR